VARTPRKPPNAHLIEGDWPTGLLADDPAVAPMAEFCRRLARATEGLSLRQIEARTGVNRATISLIARGATWPDARTIALLEHGLDVELWPGPAPKP
jgi:hypothetical protein